MASFSIGGKVDNEEMALKRASELSDSAWKYSNVNLDSSILFARRALLISRQWSFKQLEAYSLADIGKAYTLQDVFDSAGLYLQRSLTIRLAEGNVSDMIGGYNNLAKYFQMKEEYDSAIYCFQKGLELAKSEGMMDRQSTLFNGLGICYLVQGDYPMAEESLLRALSIEESLANAEHLGQRYQNLGNLYFKVSRYDDAMKYYQLAEAIYQEGKNNEGLGDVLINEGSIHQFRGNYSDAIKKFELALDLSQKHGFLDNRLSLLNNLGLIYLNMGNDTQASALFHQGIELAIELDKEKAYVELGSNYLMLLVSRGQFEKAEGFLPQLKNSIDNLGLVKFLIQYSLLKAQVFAGLGKYKEAHAAQNLYIGLTDSLGIVIDEAQASLAQMEQVKRDQKILEQENQLKTREIKQQRAESQLQRLGVLLLMVVFLAVIIFFIMRLRQVKIKKKSEENLLKVLRQVDVQMLETQIEANNATSHKIGQDLHDNLSSKLAVIQMSVDGLRGKVDPLSSDVSSRFDEIEQWLEESCDEVRNIAHDLQDRELKHRNLIKEIDQFVQLINKSEGLQVHFEPAKLPVQMKKRAQREIASVAKLLIENVLRHAKAKDLTIRLVNGLKFFSLIVQDNGLGFNVEKVSVSGGNGLSNAKLRAEKLGGEFTINSTPGKGTIATMKIPVITE